MRKPENIPRIIIYSILGFALAFVLGWLIQLYIIFPYKIKNNDMEPYLKQDSIVFFKRIGPNSLISTGDVILLRHPTSPDFIMIRRIIAGTGDKPPENIKTPMEKKAASIIEENHYYLLADNRKNTIDSRHLGSISGKQFIAKHVKFFGL